MRSPRLPVGILNAGLLLGLLPRSTAYTDGPNVGNLVTGEYCDGPIEGSLQAAMESCDADPACSVIHAYDCQAWAWRPCQGSIEEIRAASATQDACTKLKGEASSTSAWPQEADSTGTTTTTTTTSAPEAFVEGPAVDNAAYQGICEGQWSTAEAAEAACDLDAGCLFVFGYDCLDWAWTACGGGAELSQMVAGSSTRQACTRVHRSLVTSTETLSSTQSATTATTTSSTASTASTTLTTTATTSTAATATTNSRTQSTFTSTSTETPTPAPTLAPTPAPTTEGLPIASDLAVGAVSLSLADESGYDIGDLIVIWDGVNSQGNTIVAKGTLTLKDPLLFAFSKNSTLVALLGKATSTGTSTTGTSTTATATSGSATATSSSATAVAPAAVGVSSDDGGLLAEIMAKPLFFPLAAAAGALVLACGMFCLAYVCCRTRRRARRSSDTQKKHQTSIPDVGRFDLQIDVQEGEPEAPCIPGTHRAVLKKQQWAGEDGRQQAALAAVAPADGELGRQTGPLSLLNQDILRTIVRASSTMSAR